MAVIPNTSYQQILNVNPNLHEYYTGIAKKILSSAHIGTNEYLFPPDDTLQFPVLSKWSTIYFHTISECLLQLYHISKFYNSSIKLQGLIGKRYNAIQSIALAFMPQYNVQKNIINSDVVWSSNSIAYTGIYNHAAINDMFSDLINSVVNNWAPNANATNLIYISRISSKNRPLTNELELIEHAKRLGYDIIDPSKMPFIQQVRLFSSAKVVAGLHGSGLVNAAFCKPNSILLEFRPLYRSANHLLINETYRRIAAVRQLQYDCSIYENTDATWTIDIPRAVNSLELAAAKQ